VFKFECEEMHSYCHTVGAAGNIAGSEGVRVRFVRLNVPIIHELQGQTSKQLHTIAL
jgi:hypothetical protein